MTLCKLALVFGLLGLAACSSTATGNPVHHDDADETEATGTPGSTTPPASTTGSSSGGTPPATPECKVDFDCNVGHQGCVDGTCKPHTAMVTVNGVAATVYDTDVILDAQVNVTFGAPNVNFGSTSLFTFYDIVRTGEGCDKVLSDSGPLSQTVILNADIDGHDDVCGPQQHTCGLTVSQVHPLMAIYNGTIKDQTTGKTYSVVVSFTGAH